MWQYRVTTDAGAADEDVGDWMALTDEDDAVPTGKVTLRNLENEPTTVNIRAVSVYATGNIAGPASASGEATPNISYAPIMVTSLMAEPGNGRLMVSWRTPRGNDLEDITYYQSRHVETPEDGMMPAYDAEEWTDWDRLVPLSTTTADNLINSFSITGLTNGQSYTVQVRAVRVIATGETGEGTHPGAAATTMGTPDIILPDVVQGLPSLTPGSDGSGSTTSYTVAFQILDGDDTTAITVNTRETDLVIEFNEDYSVPENDSQHFGSHYYRYIHRRFHQGSGHFHA